VSDPILLYLERKPGIEHKLQHGNSNEHNREVFSWLECVWKCLRDQDNSVMTAARRRPDDIQFGSILVKGTAFFVPCVLTSSLAHPDSYPVGSVPLFSWGNAASA
jgi:hypothetical protein